MLYPNSTPEFRILVKTDGTQEFQVRYISEAVGYKSSWQQVQVVYEDK